jgi:hypothetical protein
VGPVYLWIGICGLNWLKNENIQETKSSGAGGVAQVVEHLLSFVSPEFKSLYCQTTKYWKASKSKTNVLCHISWASWHFIDPQFLSSMHLGNLPHVSFIVYYGVRPIMTASVLNTSNLFSFSHSLNNVVQNYLHSMV